MLEPISICGVRTVVSPRATELLWGQCVGALISVAVSLTIVIALCVSIVAFWRDSQIGARSVRRLASASSAITLLIIVVIYAGEFRRNALSALTYIGVDEQTYADAYKLLTDVDDFIVRVVESIRPSDAGVWGHAYPPAWPAILLIVGYTIRFLIYRLHTKKANANAALTGSVYWSHITTYAMTMAFLIVVFGWNPALVVSMSLAILAVATVSIKLWLADLGTVARIAGKSIWTVVSNGARRIAYAATALAAFVRIAANYANRAYVEKIRKPLMTKVDKLEEWNKDQRDASAQKLKDQDDRHALRFRPEGETAGSERPGGDPPKPTSA
jgi:hypothetical protein